jgi:hypothetical protein
VILAPWSSSLIRRSEFTRRGSTFASPIGYATIAPVHPRQLSDPIRKNHASTSPDIRFTWGIRVNMPAQQAQVRAVRLLADVEQVTDHRHEAPWRGSARHELWRMQDASHREKAAERRLHEPVRGAFGQDGRILAQAGPR